jgi:hypothetical protein
MQLLKASALVPTVERAAWRSQSDASRLSVLAGLLSVGCGPKVSLDDGELLLPVGAGGYEPGGTHPAKTNVMTRINFFMRTPSR